MYPANKTRGVADSCLIAEGPVLMRDAFDACTYHEVLSVCIIPSR